MPRLPALTTSSVQEPSRIPVPEQEGWQLLRSHFVLTRQFAVVVLIAPDEWTLDQIHQHLPGLLPAGETARDIPFQPHFPPATLTELILARHSSADNAQHLWVDVPAPAVTLSDPALAPWHAAFSYLNRHRNHLPKVIPGTLIIAGTPETLVALREAAPDLWSIRSALIQFSPAPVLPGYDLHDSQKRQRRSNYLRALLSAFSAYQELALDNYSGADQACPDIWDIFVHPACAKDHLRPEDIDAAQRETPPRLPAEDLLPILGSDTERRHVLLADPGMGKSTLIQSLIAHLASGRSFTGAAALTGLLPVPLILRDLVPLLPQDQPESWTWDSLITVLLEQYQREETAPLLLEAYRDHAAEFRQLIHSSDKVFFLIDGLDEIGDRDKRLQIVRAIQEGIRTANKGARWLITSRVIGYDEAPVDEVLWSDKHLDYFAAFRRHPRIVNRCEIEAIWTEYAQPWMDLYIQTGDEPLFNPIQWGLKDHALSAKIHTHGSILPQVFNGFHRIPVARRLYLAPFDDKRQDAFTSRWFRHRHSTDYSKELMREVRAHHHDGVRIISRVPNLLCMMNMLKRSGKPLPDGRAALYDEIVKAYLGGIDSAYKFKPIHGHTCPFEASERRHLLSILGAHMQQSRMGRAANLSTIVKALSSPNSPLSTDSSPDTEGNILITMPELVQLLIPPIEVMRNAGKVRSDHSAASLLDELLHHIASRSGLLIPRSSDVEGNTIYGFSHLSFMEFFAAEWLGKEFDRLQKRLARQAEAMADGMTLSESDLAREFPAPQSIEHKRADFPTLAASPVWHEPLIFLVESRKSDTATLLRWLFPALHSSQPYTVPEDKEKTVPLIPLEAVRLAVQLAHDQELSLSPETRRRWWRTLWAAYLIWPHPPWEYLENKSWPIAPLLLDREEHRMEVIQALVEVYTKGLGLSAKLPPPPLYLYQCSQLTSVDLSELGELRQLETLNLISCTGLESLPDLSAMQGLKELDLIGCNGLRGPKALSGLSGLRQLEKLDLIGCTGLESLPDLSAMHGLKWLDLRYCNGLRGPKALSGLSGLRQLETLDLSGCTGLESLPDLSAMQGLKELDLIGCNGLRGPKALSGLSGLRQLETLDLSGCTGLESLPDLSAMQGLQLLDLTGCTGLKDREGVKERVPPGCRIVGL